MNLPLQNPEKPKAPRAAKPKPAPDAARLKRLAARIEEMKDTRLPELEDELFRFDKMRMTTANNVMIITLAGIRGESAAGLHMALTNWAMAARRELLKLEG